MILLFVLITTLASWAGDSDFEIRWSKILHRDTQDANDFWLASRNGTDEEELKDTIKAFRSVRNLHTNDHPQCLYPARRMLIEKYLGTHLYNKSKCPDLDKWMEDLSPQGITIVFAGNYPENPGSLFGHTFLKFNSDHRAANQVLDYALNFSADVNDEMGLLYAFKGLFGAYLGTASLAPYYRKLNEYNEGEGRDIWEYETNFSAQEARFILAHIWELKHRAQFEYFFLDENCSLFIVKLLDIVRPELSLEKDLPWYIIPLETIKVMQKKKEFIKNVKYRPSVRLRGERTYNSLNWNEKREAQKLLTTHMKASEFNNQKVLHAAAMQLASIQSKNNGQLPIDLARKEDEILLKLSEFEKFLTDQDIQLPSPHLGHDVIQFSAGFLSQESVSGLIGIRPGVHEMSDHNMGYLPFSELLVMDSYFRFDENQISIQKIDFLSLALLRPWTYHEKNFSWSFRSGFEGHSMILNNNKQAFYNEGLIGLSILSAEKILVTGLVGAFNRTFSTKFDGPAGAMFQLMIANQHENWNLYSGMRYYYDLMTSGENRKQVSPYANLTYHFNVNFDLVLETFIPMTLENHADQLGQFILKTDYHF